MSPLREDNDLKEKARALKLELDAIVRASGYHLNPDDEMVLFICEGLQTNIERYGYPGCPCRLLDGELEKDLDLVCPCDYRDLDLEEYGTCYCGLYVSEDVAAGKKKAGPIPERRLAEREYAEKSAPAKSSSPGRLTLWRCRVCGYLAAREHPPERCPICRAQKERFEPFSASPSLPVWRCRVCGYLAGREHPPERCPVCKAQKERFELFRFP